MHVVTRVIVGFDSAWMNNPRKPGAITALQVRADGVRLFVPPRLATFGQASDFVSEYAGSAEYVLIAVDQPTIVTNRDGCRPVERVAGSVVNSLKGGVQPAHQGKPMFGAGAPIWRFLENVQVDQNPTLARVATHGRFCVEVFPALSLPALVPEIWQRRRAAKYNPANRLFQINEWRMVAEDLASYARAQGDQEVALWSQNAAEITRPTKADQDRLDALACLLIAAGWRFGPRESFAQIGNLISGYMVTAVCPEMRARLERKSREVYEPVVYEAAPPLWTH